jgi:hypothetical protein
LMFFWRGSVFFIKTVGMHTGFYNNILGREK